MSTVLSLEIIGDNCSHYGVPNRPGRGRDDAPPPETV
jgi:hypothetical protein